MSTATSKPQGEFSAQAADPCAVVIFGASGDLARCKVIPAFYDLAARDALAPRYAIAGFARTPMTDEAFRTTATEATKSISEVGPIDAQKWEAFASNLCYFPGEYGNPESYTGLAKRLAALDQEKKLGGNRLFYLSTPP